MSIEWRRMEKRRGREIKLYKPTRCAESIYRFKGCIWAQWALIGR